MCPFAVRKRPSGALDGGAPTPARGEGSSLTVPGLLGAHCGSEASGHGRDRRAPRSTPSRAPASVPRSDLDAGAGSRCGDRRAPCASSGPMKSNNDEPRWTRCLPAHRGTRWRIVRHRRLARGARSLVDRRHGIMDAVCWPWALAPGAAGIFLSLTRHADALPRPPGTRSTSALRR